MGDEIGPKHNIWNGSTGNNLSGSGNWNNAVAPATGEVLRFANVTNKTVVNDFPTGTSFAGIVFEPGKFSGGYNLSGNAITLTGDIINLGGYGSSTVQTGPTVNFPIILNGDRQFNLGDFALTVNAGISGSGSLTKTTGADHIRGAYDGGCHKGDLFLTENCTYTGETRITGGAIVLKNSNSTNLISTSPSIKIYHNSVLKVNELQDETFVLSSGQTLRAYQGKVLGNLTASTGSTVAPGLEKTGQLVQLGDYTMTSGSELNIRIDGVDAYDYINVNGSVSLGGATLNLAEFGTYSSVIGDRFTVIVNDEMDTVNGTFVSGTGTSLSTGTPLSEGTVITDLFGSGSNARISYQGGDGNDVVLTILPPAGSPVFIEPTFSTADAEEMKAYSATIADTALDAETIQLTYSKVSGPDWLIVSPDGTMSGTPTSDDAGKENVFTVQASDNATRASVTATLSITVIERKLVGRWDFNDPANLTKATIGTDLTLVGTNTAITGAETGDGAANIGVGSYYSCLHGISPNGGGSEVNEYTLLFDMRLPASSVDGWKAIFQTNTANSDDAECFLRGGGGVKNSVGLSSTGYSSWAFPTDTWVRLAIAVDNGTSYKIYADGVLIKTGTVQAIDSKYGLDSSVLFFADNSGEDNPIDVTSIQLYKAALSDTEVAELGGVSDLVLAPTCTTSNFSDDGFTLSWDSNPSVLSYNVKVYNDVAMTKLVTSIDNVTTPLDIAVSMEKESKLYYSVTADYGTTSYTSSGEAFYSDLVGLWDFNDGSDLTKAIVGSALETSGTGFVVATGASASDSAVTVDSPSYYIATHGLDNGSEYTVVLDFKIPAVSKYYALLQTNVANSDDADIFVRNWASAQVGISNPGYSGSVADLDWHRLYVVRSGSSYKFYMFDADGSENSGAANGLIGDFTTTATKFNLDSSSGKVLIGADDNGENNAYDISQLAIYSRPLTLEEIIAKTNKPGLSILYETPEAVADSYTLENDGSLAGDVTANDTIQTPHPTTVATLVDSPTESLSFSLNGDGTFTYQHDTTKTNITDSFTYKLSDGTSESETVTVTISLLPLPVVTTSNVTSEGFTASWSSNAKATTYKVEVYSDENLSSLLTTVDPASTPELIAMELSYDTPVYCSVTANYSGPPVTSETVEVQLVTPNITGKWLFDNAANLGEATIGAEITAAGLVNVEEVEDAVQGVSALDGAVSLDKSEHLIVEHGLTDGTNWTMAMDFMAPDVSSYSCFYDVDGNGDGNAFIKNGAVGFSGYSGTVTAGEWHRIVLVYSDNSLKFWLYDKDGNGGLVNTRGGTGFALNTTIGTVQIANDGSATGTSQEEKEFNLSQLVIFDRALNAAEVALQTVPGEEIKPMASVITPALGLEVVQNGTELSWTIDDEINVKEYRVINAVTGEVIAVIVSGQRSYTTTLPAGITAKLVVVDNSSFTQTFHPENGNLMQTTYVLNEGWNLLAPTGDSADWSTLGDTFWSWESDAYQLIDSPKTGQAFWCYSPEKREVVVTVERVIEKPITLKQGWNMVGPTVNTAVPENALTIYSWNGIYQQVAQKDQVLLQGIGYWIFSL